jgi:hypothetical protein
VFVLNILIDFAIQKLLEILYIQPKKIYQAKIIFIQSYLCANKILK